MKRGGTGNRDLAIDATRGVAIWSMVTAHFATDAPLASPTHAFPYVDGMSAFVMLSGIVLGLVYQRWVNRYGLRFATCGWPNGSRSSTCVSC